MTDIQTRSWTLEDLIREGLDPDRYEIVDGEPVELEGLDVPGAWIRARLAALLVNYLEKRPIGVALDNARCRLRHDPLILDRLPDLAIYRWGRVSLPLPESVYEGAPDLAIEIVSATDEDGDIARKAREFIEHGSREVWIVRPSLNEISVLRPGEPSRALDERDTLETDVLPGFSLPLARLFAPPSVAHAAPPPASGPAAPSSTPSP